MAISVVQLGSPRGRDEGIRIGTARRPPRGVKKEDYARLDYFDVWLPQLAPSADLLRTIHETGITAANWKNFEKRYRHELDAPDTARLLDLLALLSKGTNFSVGCYCDEESRCHRSILRQVLQARGAAVR